MRTLLRLIVHNWMLKLTAVILALLLWTMVKADEPARTIIRDVPIEVVVRDPGWRLAAPPAPTTASVEITGPYRELIQAVGDRPRIRVLVDEVLDSTELHPLQPRLVQLDSDLQRALVLEVQPSSVLLKFERLTTRLLPVAIRTRGVLPPGLELSGSLRADPPAIRVSGPTRRLREMDSVPLSPIDLGQVSGPTVFTVAVDSVQLRDLIFSPRRVEVHVTPVAVDTIPADTVPADTASPPIGPEGA